MSWGAIAGREAWVGDLEILDYQDWSTRGENFREFGRTYC